MQNQTFCVSAQIYQIYVDFIQILTSTTIHKSSAILKSFHFSLWTITNEWFLWCFVHSLLWEPQFSQQLDLFTFTANNRTNQWNWLFDVWCHRSLLYTRARTRTIPLYHFWINLIAHRWRMKNDTLNFILETRSIFIMHSVFQFCMKLVFFCANSFLIESTIDSRERKATS